MYNLGTYQDIKILMRLEDYANKFLRIKHLLAYGAGGEKHREITFIEGLLGLELTTIPVASYCWQVMEIKYLSLAM